MPDIFLSYNREDQARAKLFAEAFTSQGFDVWWDTALSPGEAYDQVTEKALREAKAVVVLWSKRSVDSRWVRAEATLADRNGTLVPAMIEACERPIMFELTQTADLSKWGGDANDATWRAFITGVRRFTDRGPVTAALSEKRDSVAKTDTAAADLPILAVLPFDNQSPDPDLQFFSDGVAEEILNAMMQVAGLRVIGATSSFSFRGERKKDAARALGATHVLDGSVRRSGQQVRITARLTEASKDHMLWSERYDRDLTDAFAVQDEIASETAKALKTKLAPSAPKAQIDPQAYDLYLRALSVRKSPDAPAQYKAIAYLEAAVAIEPDFARARAALASGLCQKIIDATVRGAKPEAFDEAVAAVRQQATKALQLDPNDTEAQLALVSLEPGNGNWQAQERVYDAALMAAPNDLYILYERARWLLRVGRMREGFALCARGYEIDPLSPTWMILKATQLYAFSGDPVGAEALAAQAFAAAPNQRYTWATRVQTLMMNKKWDDARRMLDGSHPLPSTANEEVRSFLLWRLEILAGGVNNSSSSSDETRRRFIDMTVASAQRWSFETPNAAVRLWAIGQVDDGFDLLDEAMRNHPPERIWSQWNVSGSYGGGANVLFFVSPTLSGYGAMRNSPRFLTLCAKLGLCTYWAETGHWPDYIVDAPNRAELEVEVRRLAAPNA